MLSWVSWAPHSGTQGDSVSRQPLRPWGGGALGTRGAGTRVSSKPLLGAVRPTPCAWREATRARATGAPAPGRSDQDDRTRVRNPGPQALCGPWHIRLSSPHGVGQGREAPGLGDAHLGRGLSHSLPAPRPPQRHPYPILGARAEGHSPTQQSTPGRGPLQAPILVPRLVHAASLPHSGSKGHRDPRGLALQD